MKRSGVNPKRAPRRREAPQETSQDWWAMATHLLMCRGYGKCDRCGLTVEGQPIERHHRQRRRDGGDRLSNLLILHPACHRWITEHPEEAVENGWIVLTELDPVDVPVLIAGRYWFLDDIGARHLRDEPQVPPPRYDPDALTRERFPRNR